MAHYKEIKSCLLSDVCLKPPDVFVLTDVCHEVPELCPHMAPKN